MERNALNLSNLFEDIDTVVITDSQKSYSRLKKLGVNTWLCSDQLLTNPEILLLSKHNSRFRANFWLKTVLRFFALEEYMIATNLEEVLHIEADVWISPNFPIEKIRRVSSKLAFPLKSHNQGIASTVYIPSLLILSIFNRFILDTFREDPLSTDVSILGCFHIRYPELFFNLPTALPLKNFHSDFTHYKDSIDLSENFNLFDGLFDASSLGIFYTGIDPRNNWGWRDLFVKLDHKIDFANSTLLMKDQMPFMHYGDVIVPIFSLHVHSKDDRFFDYESSVRRLNYISIQDQSHIYREFSLLQTPKILIKTLLIKLILFFRDFFR